MLTLLTITITVTSCYSETEAAEWSPDIVHFTIHVFGFSTVTSQNVKKVCYSENVSWHSEHTQYEENSRVFIVFIIKLCITFNIQFCLSRHYKAMFPSRVSDGLISFPCLIIPAFQCDKHKQVNIIYYFPFLNCYPHQPFISPNLTTV